MRRETVSNSPMKKLFPILILLCLTRLAFSQQQVIGLGTIPNDHTGDPARVAGAKINANFTQLFNAGLPAALLNTNSALIGQGTNFFVINAALAAAAGYPTNLSTLATLAQLTTQLSGVTNFIFSRETNGTTPFNLASSTNLPFAAITNSGLLIQWSQQPTNAFLGTNVYGALTKFYTNVVTSVLVSGNGTVSATTNANGIAVSISVQSQTNGFGTIVYSNANAYFTGAQVTNAIISVASTNSLAPYATTNYVVLYVNGATNGFVGTNDPRVVYAITNVANVTFSNLTFVGTSTNTAANTMTNPANIFAGTYLGLGTASFSNANAFITPPQLAAATNGSAQSSVTFSLAIGAAATNNDIVTSNGAVNASVILKTAATNGLPAGIWTLGTASQSSSSAFATPTQLTAATNSSTLSANAFSLTLGGNATNNDTVTSNGVVVYSKALATGLAVNGTNNANLVSNSVVAFSTNTFIPLTNGVATVLQIQKNLRFNNWTNFNLTGNLIGSFDGGVPSCNSTWENISTTMWTNVIFPNWIIQFTGGNYYMQSNGVSYFQNTELEGKWTQVIPFGTAQTPYSAFGSYWNMNGTKMVGYVYSTNITAQITNSIATTPFSPFLSNEVAQIVLANASNPTNGVSSTTVTNIVVSLLVSSNYTTASQVTNIVNALASTNSFSLATVTNVANQQAVLVADNVTLGGVLFGTPTNASFNATGTNTIRFIATNGVVASGVITNAGGVTQGFLTNQSFSATGTNAIDAELLKGTSVTSSNGSVTVSTSINLFGTTNYDLSVTNSALANSSIFEGVIVPNGQTNWGLDASSYKRFDVFLIPWGVTAGFTNPVNLYLTNLNLLTISNANQDYFITLHNFTTNAVAINLPQWQSWLSPDGSTLQPTNLGFQREEQLKLSISSPQTPWPNQTVTTVTVTNGTQNGQTFNISVNGGNVSYLWTNNSTGFDVVADSSPAVSKANLLSKISSAGFGFTDRNVLYFQDNSATNFQIYAVRNTTLTASQTGISGVNWAAVSTAGNSGGVTGAPVFQSQVFSGLEPTASQFGLNVFGSYQGSGTLIANFPSTAQVNYFSISNSLVNATSFLSINGSGQWSSTEGLFDSFFAISGSGYFGIGSVTNNNSLAWSSYFLGFVGGGAPSFYLNGTTITTNAYDADALDYFARAGITNNPAYSTISNSVNAMVVSLKNNNLWTNLVAVYPFQPATTNGDAQNLISANHTISWGNYLTNTFAHTVAGITNTSALDGYGETGIATNNSTPYQSNSVSMSMWICKQDAKIPATTMFLSSGHSTTPVEAFAYYTLGIGNQLAYAGINGITLGADSFSGVGGYTNKYGTTNIFVGYSQTWTNGATFIASPNANTNGPITGATGTVAYGTNTLWLSDNTSGNNYIIGCSTVGGFMTTNQMSVLNGIVSNYIKGVGR